MRIPATPMDVQLEFGYRFVFTDYLDDVSTRYANLDQFDSQLARVMSDRSAEAIGVWKGEKREDFTTVQLQFGDEYYYVNGSLRSNVEGESIRGNPKNNDMYFVTQIRVTYIIPPKTSRSAKYR